MTIDNPSLSILVPSRGRANILKFSLDTLGLEKNNLEVLTWVDEDDPQLKTYHQLFDGNKRIKMFVKPRVGYKNYPIMADLLAAQSTGDWIFLWNDDAYMDNPDWYKTFIEYSSLVDPQGEPIALNIWGQGAYYNAFPIISRKYYEIIGHIAENTCCDKWINRVAYRARVQRTIFGIKPKHRKYGHDEKFGNLEDQTKIDIDRLRQKSRFFGFYSGGRSRLMREECQKILDFTKKRHAGFIGLGKLGLPVALAMEARGNRIAGYDVNPKIRNYLQEKKVPFQEEQVQGLLGDTQLEILDSIEEVVQKTDLIFCTVQTPHDPRFEGDKPLSKKRTDFDYSYLKKAVKGIALAAKKLNKKITLVVISTCLPGTYKREIKPLLTPNINYIYNPYFIAMGTVINDFYNPEFILIGKDQGDVTPLTNFYKLTLGQQQVFITDITTAEGIKMLYNTFITSKIVFANTYGEMAHKLGMNADHIYQAFSLSTNRINSPKYLKPGVGDGGACHIRDNIAMSYLAEKTGLSFNIFEGFLAAREEHMEWLASLAKNESKSSGLPIVILGKAFKPETNIETGSSAILLANILKGKKVKFTHWGLDYPKRLPKAVYILASQHNEYLTLEFPNGSVIIDPHRYINKRDGIKIISIGGNI